MSFRGFRVQTAIIVFVLVLVCGLGLQIFLQVSQIITPLTNQLQALPGVEEAVLTRGTFFGNSRAIVELRLAEGVSVATTFGQVSEILAEKGGVFLIKLEDNPDQKLLDIFQRIQLVAEESIMTGQFTLLEERVQTLALRQGLDWELAVDRDFIFLRLSHENQILDRVIPRNANEGKIIVLQGRSGIGG